MRTRLCLLLICLVPAGAFAQAPTAPCSAPEARQFDFWVGRWDLTWIAVSGATETGTNHITRMWEDCGIEENFAGEIGGQSFLGHSVSMWSPRRGKWRQTWVDNQGSFLDFEGGMEGDRMVLYGTGAPMADGTPTRTRMTFLNIEENSLDWHWERSTDDGATWQVLWKIHYQRAD